MISLYELKYFEIRIHIKKHQLQYIDQGHYQYYTRT